MEVLCCPMCKGDLTLSVKKREKTEILDGELFCPRCAIHYPIEEGIPNLLPPDERD